MKRIMHINAVLIAFFSILLCNDAFSWDDGVTHKDLSEYAAYSSVLRACKYETDINCDYLKKLGFNKGLDKEELKWDGNTTIKRGYIKDWLKEGAKLEDSSGPLSIGYLDGKGRSFNHFHNAWKQAPWLDAGLDDWIPMPPLHVTGKSSLLWAQDGAYQEGFYEKNWSWNKTREFFYTALTGRDFSGNVVAPDETTKKEYFAKTFRGLGHQMHLLQDTAVPDHVRNDAHPEDAMFGKDRRFGNYYLETWAKTKIFDLATLKSFAPNPIFPNAPFNTSHNGLVPVTQLYDTDTYDGLNASAGINQGLAEYTNANFFSGDTIFAAERYSSDHRHYFPYPKKTSTDLQSYIDQNKLPETIISEDNVQDTGFWIKKERDGESIDHFVKPAYYTNLINPILNLTLYSRTFYLDNNCHEDYARKLLPRAVGYSAGLLNYFFRGTLEISAPNTYVYSITDGSKIPQQFTKIKAKVKNSTPNEVMSDGILQAVARYKIVPNYDPNLANYPPNGTTMQTISFSYSVSAPLTLTPEKLASMNVHPTEFTFDFTNSPIPAGITDLYLQVVFKGTLGNELDSAIAVGMKDLMEPTHHVFWNSTDRFLLDGVLYTATEIRNTTKLRNKVDHDRDKVLNEIHEGEPHIDPYNIHFNIAYMNTSPPANPVVYSATASNLPPGRHIRLIVLVDNNYVDNWFRFTHFDTVFNVDKNSDYSFHGVTNQEENGLWLQPTPLKILRGIRQHFYAGVVACQPIATVPETGVKYCPYPETAPPPADPAPYPVTIINFQ